ncbi:hypothetical protein EIN_028620 [Entamoeba invadens IP1]|uniref:Uncharacterized protein n=1 Tax=Entamoeba invadens IP1 TaxID=370355 RepID=L7FKR7_ENTIV|nr:hypothetical protein EIN_028620 [Entamoeba invadens IP1]ELP87077.1 hypothetical protein EIN_028620 [Entamoeba invadens IP1]|eukprot:XP_004253848.1 hypothetical protein EIN_028620 [Entamoeba invadens IP1]
MELKRLEKTETLNLLVVFIYVQKQFHNENLLNRNLLNRLLLLSFKTPSTLSTNSEIGSDCSKRYDQHLREKELTSVNSQLKTKKLKLLKKKLAEEIAKREVAEKALSEMKIKNVDLETLV